MNMNYDILMKEGWTILKDEVPDGFVHLEKEGKVILFDIKKDIGIPFNNYRGKSYLK